MAKLDPNPYPLPEPNWQDFRNSPDTKVFDALLEASNNLDLDSGEVEGGMLRWQRADGYAWYIVTKAKPLTVQHVPYGDAWSIEPALIRGLNMQDVLEQLIRAKRMHDLFSAKP
jgi:hypothetical protein